MTTPDLLARDAPPQPSPQGSLLRLGASLLPVIFVAAVWTALYVGDLAYVRTFGVNAPNSDDWEFVPIATHPGIDLRWAFSQHMEHRSPLPRLLVLGLLKLSHLDFRSGMYFNVTALALLALAMVLTARFVRGRTIYFDAFFPLILMNLGNWDAFLFTCNVDFASTTVLGGIVLLGVVNRGNRLGIGSASLLGIAAILLTMTGGHGLLFAPLPAIWLACAGIATIMNRSGRERIAGVLALVLALTALASFAFSCLTFQSVEQPRRLGVSAVLSTAVSFAGLGFGKPGGLFGTIVCEALFPLVLLAVCRLALRRRLTWAEIAALLGCAVLVRVLVDQCERAHLPLPLPSQRVVWGLIALAAATLAAGLLIRAARSLPAERWRALGLLACLGGSLCLAAGLGFARAGSLSETHYTPRYFIVAVGLPCVVGFAVEIYGRLQLVKFARPVLLTLAAVLAVSTIHDAVLFGRSRSEALRALLADVRAGVPAETIVFRHRVMGLGYLQGVGPKELVQDLKDLRDAGHRGFQGLNDSPSPQSASH